ncbi:MAG: dTDP-4-dehydrorhamnose 3,5-epimerase [Sandaracinaceae bacterium]|nr:dTDP-4-dehydrorhamnose 3,5-epimerase [Sandaracinaceae bacterium]
MRVTPTELPEVLFVEPTVHRDARGLVLETYRRERYVDCGIDVSFVQDNLSRSGPGVLRGLHLQRDPHSQAKLVYAVTGRVWDVAVDVRAGSPSFGRWAARELAAETMAQLFIPAGFAHGFCVLEAPAVLAYKCSDVHHPELELTIAHDDPDLEIAWPIVDPVLSEKDRSAPRLRDVAPELLPALPQRSR